MKTQACGDIWELESPMERDYGYSLSVWIQDVIDEPSDAGIAAIRALWDNESWESIVERFQTEGSTWAVWFSDGLNAYMKLDKE